jgi:methylated-DNA-[protein]-cysteine S-methyltransferase
MNGAPKRFLIDGDSWWSIETPYGEMLLGGNEEVLHHVLLPNSAACARPALEETDRGRPGEVARAEVQLKEYFAGDRREFDLVLEPVGTDFQRAVWLALSTIGYGKTASYGDIARHIGRPTAFRAVGLANGANPLPVVLPCHRVIGSDGSLTGFGGGLDLKAQMLEHERAVLQASA